MKRLSWAVKLLLCVFIMCSTMFSAVFAVNTSITFDYCLEYDKNPATDGSDRFPVPMTYNIGERFVLPEKTGGLKDARDMYVGQAGEVYIADTGNNRIVLLNKKGEVVKIWSQGLGLRQPQGIYVRKDEIYIADTDNYRILRIDYEGNIIKEYFLDDTQLENVDTKFAPRKLVVSDTNIIYVVSGDNLMAIDLNGTFIGYVGETKSTFSFTRLLIRMFATREQKKQIPPPTRPQFRSVSLSNDGYIYGITTNEYVSQIVKINSIGKNLYPSIYYGERYVNEQNEMITSSFTGVAVSSKDVVTAIDGATGKLYQYDKNGTNLCVFGSGNSPDKRGDIFSAQAIGMDGQDTIYVLDSGTGAVQKYIPTDFINVLHNAMKCYYDGEYERSKEYFNKALSINNNHRISHWGLGNVYYQLKDYNRAMEEFKIADYKTWYSDSFDKARQIFAENNFLVIVLCLAVVVTLLILIIPRLKRLAKRFVRQYFDRY